MSIFWSVIYYERPIRFLISFAVEGPSRSGILKSKKISLYILGGGDATLEQLSSMSSCSYLGILDLIILIAYLPFVHRSDLTLSVFNCSCIAKIMNSESSTMSTSESAVAGAFTSGKVRMFAAELL